MPSTSEQEINHVVSACQAAGYDAKTCGRTIISKVSGVSEKVARRIQDVLRGGVDSNAPYAGESDAAPETHEHEGDAWRITMPKTPIHTLEALVEHCEIDLSVWEVEKWTCKKWDMSCVPRSTRTFQDAKWVRPSTVPVTVENFAITAWLRRKVAVVAILSEIKALKDEAKKDARVYKPINRRQERGGYLLEISIPDLHMGKLCWGDETGGRNYDSSIAQQDFDNALTALLRRTSSYDFDRVLFTVGNDLLHTDSKAGLTTGGTPQDVDGRYQKTFVKTRRMISRAIERLREVAPVDVLMVPGNHDTLSVWHLGDSLECAFENCLDVTVNNSPNPMKFYEWGKVMLMLVHGHKGKKVDYPLVMASQKPEMWGRTKFREVRTGHLHQERVTELHGVKVRVSSALCPPDAWHAENMYTGNQQSADAFVWHNEEGMVGQATYTVPNTN
jgi:hypothetical protein